MDASYIKLGAEILFGIAALGFVIYSIVAMYALNAYGRSKSMASSLSVIYSAAAAGLLAWGFVLVMGIQ